MCGIWGYVAHSTDGPDLARLSRIIRTTEQRGKHAFGFAWIDGSGKLRAFKAPGRLSERIEMIDRLADARMVIGHARYATHGDPGNNLNNHPFACDGGWIVHNGVIREHEQIHAEFNREPVTDCDSEALVSLIEEHEGTLSTRCATACSSIDASASLAMMGLWPRSGRMIVIRRGNPLHVGTTARGHYLGSLPDGLPKNVESIANWSGIEFAGRAGEVKETAFALARPAVNDEINWSKRPTPVAHPAGRDR